MPYFCQLPIREGEEHLAKALAPILQDLGLHSANAIIRNQLREHQEYANA
jgi:hypothetical protein